MMQVEEEEVDRMELAMNRRGYSHSKRKLQGIRFTLDILSKWPTIIIAWVLRNTFFKT